MTYSEAIDYLYHKTVSFETMGGAGYKPGLERVEILLEKFGNPHRSLKTIHVAGTNGKGSTASLIASVLQAAGYRVGLFTSPHLLDFRERIRINGEMISEEAVAAFVEAAEPLFKRKADRPSFFELTTAMAFDYFARQNTDYAVIEVGMGGRLDSTNVITPLVSIITNVSMDHTQYLGDTITKIAEEKAGIIKPGVPLILGNSRDADVNNVIKDVSFRQGAKVIPADRTQEIMMHFFQNDVYRLSTVHFGNLTLPLVGAFQIENAATVLQALLVLMEKGVKITPENVKKGFLEVAGQGLRARIEVLRERGPRIIADTGHNPGSWVYIANYLSDIRKERHVVCILGFSSDKDIKTVLSLIPRTIPLLFAKADSPRAKSSKALTRMAKSLGFAECLPFENVSEAYAYALESNPNKERLTIFIGGSFYLVGDFLRTGEVL